MNREIWFRILQVAVVAPWLYYISTETKSVYFRTGLKLVAGSIIMLNVKPLWEDYKTAQQFIAKLQTETETKTLPTIIEGEADEIIS